MAVTQNSYTGNNSTTTYSFTFPYLKQDEIKASLDGEPTTAFDTPTATTVQFNTAPGTGVKIKIYRETDSDSLAATFYAGSAIKSEDLNDNFTQNLYATQEVTERYVSNLGGTMTGDLNLGEDVVVKFEGGTDNDYETTLTVVDPTADRTITLPNVTGTVVTTGDTGTVAHAMLAGDAVDGDNINDNSINSEHYVDGSIDTAHIADAQITTAKILDSNVTTAKILDANVTTAKIADLNVTTGKIAADAITGAKIADDEIDSEHIAAGALDEEHYADGSITLAKLNGATVVTSSEQGITSPNDISFYTAAAADARYYNVGSAADIISGNTWASSGTKVATTDAIDARIVDLVEEVGGFVPIANEQSFPNANPDINNGTGTLVSLRFNNNMTADGSGVLAINAGALDDSNVTITGCGANTAFPQEAGIIVETTSTLHTYTFHRQVPKATEVTTVAGNISNVTTVSGISANVTTVAGISSNVTTVADISSNVTAVAGNASNINAVAADATDIGAVAGKATEIGRLGTTDAVADLALLGTSAVVEDLSLLGTTAAVADMALLGDSAVIADMATIADTSNLITNIGTVAGIQANVTTVSGISSNVTTVAGVASNVTTVSGISANVTTVAGIASNVTTVAGDTTAINNITTNLSAVQNAATNATNAASSATAAASSQTAAASSQTAAASSQTAAASSATAASSSQTAAASSQTAAATSATSSASSASTSTTQANNSAASASTANAHQLLAKQYRDTASGILTQTKSIAYNLVDSVSSHTNWGNITDGDTADFADESTNTFLTMAEGSATYNYGAIA